MKDKLNSFIHLNENDILSKFNSKDLRHLFFLLEDYLISYKKKLNINDDNISFGLEIETEHANIEKIKKFFWYDYTSWCYCNDSSLDSGIEIVSPILINNEKSFEQLKAVCNFLKKNSFIDQSASAHIHVGAQIYNDWGSIYHLCLIWFAFEKVIYRFSYGEHNAGRKELYYYADSMLENAKDLSDIFEKIFECPDDYGKFEKEFYEYVKKIKRYKSLNFTNVYKFGQKEKGNTIEFRCPNGTLNEVIWQNNLNFFLSLMNYAKNGLDNADFDYFVNKTNDNICSDYDYSELYLKDALELADLIFKTNQDKIDFLKQYVKCINDTNYSYDRIIKLTK